MTRPITDRIDDAITRAIKRYATGFKALYLTEDDHRLLGRELGVRCFNSITVYREIPIRRGKKSTLYDRYATQTVVSRR